MDRWLEEASLRDRRPLASSSHHGRSRWCAPHSHGSNNDGISAMLTRRDLLAGSAAGLGAGATGLRARAQAIKRPLRIIVGFPAGGGTDVIARILAERLRGLYAPAVIVENKPGAAARLAIEYVKNAEPD